MNLMPIERNRRLLVVDDNASIHADFKKILVGVNQRNPDLAAAEAELFNSGGSPPVERRDFHLTSAFQGEDAVRLVQQGLATGQRFAVAFVDVRMPPGWDGVETTERLWQLDPDLQVVICTAYSDYSWDEMLARLGTSDRLVILKKPFDAVEVLQLASALTEKWALLQQAKQKLLDLERVINDRTRELQTTNKQLRIEIQDHQLTEHALRSTQEKLNHFLAQSPAVLYSLRIECGLFLPAWISDNFTSFMGAEVADWHEQMPSLAYVEEADRAAVHASVPALLAHSHLSLQYRVRRKDGTIRWIRDDRQLLRDEAGSPVEVIGCWTDTTKQRQLEEELRQSQKMESVGLLAGGVAHDFNNMLTVIRCHIELLLNAETFSEATAKALGNVMSAADRAGNLTRQLLAFSRKQIMRPENLNVNELVQNLAQLLARPLGEHIALKTSCAPDLPGVFVDRSMMEQVIMNLSLNARDAMVRGGQLEIATSVRDIDEVHVQCHPEAQPGRYVCLAVTDTGAGISPEHLSHIFEPFFTTKAMGKGSGLGLATVYGIVKQHDGWIEVESEVGRGTTFRIYLVAVPLTEETASAARPVTSVACQGKETILVVEDELALRGLVRVTLQRQGYKVFTAESGVAALREWSQKVNEIDLLLTDMVMPGGTTGRELAEALLQQKPGLKVVYMSGYSRELNGEHCAVGNDVPFLPKPFGPQTLAQAVRVCLDAAEKSRALAAKN